MQMRTSLPLGQTRERRRLGRRRESALLGRFLKETPVIHGAVNYHFKTDKFKQNQTCYSQSEIFVEKWRTNEHACPEQKLVESGVKLERLPLFKISISRHLWVTWLVPVIQKLLEHDSVYSLHNYLLTTDKYWHFQQSYTCFGQSAVFCLNGEEFGLAWRHISWSDRRRMSLHRYKRFNLSASIYEFL